MSVLLMIVYLLIFAIIILASYAFMQLKLVGIRVKDFWGFIEANQVLDKLYFFAKQYENMSSQEQIIYLKEAEKVFKAFEKIPNELWEEEYSKYKEVLDKYKDIRMIRWSNS